MKNQSIVVTFERAVKNSVVFKNNDPETPIKSIYITNAAFKDKRIPEKIKITLEELE